MDVLHILNNYFFLLKKTTPSLEKGGNLIPFFSPTQLLLEYFCVVLLHRKFVLYFHLMCYLFISISELFTKGKNTSLNNPVLHLTSSSSR